MSNDDFELVRGSGNVFRDQGEPDADVKQAKALLAAQIIGALEDQALSVRKAAGLTGFAAADFSRVRNAELGRFSIDRLIKMLAALDEGIEVSINLPSDLLLRGQTLACSAKQSTKIHRQWIALKGVAFGAARYVRF